MTGDGVCACGKRIPDGEWQCENCAAPAMSHPTGRGSMIRTLGVSALFIALVAGCAERGYYVEKIGQDPDTGGYYLMCGHPSGPSVRYNTTRDHASRTVIGESCLDDWVERGSIPKSSSAPTTTTSSVR